MVFYSHRVVQLSPQSRLEYFHSPLSKKPGPISPFPQALATTNLLSILDTYRNRIIEYVTFWVWLLLLGTMFSRFICTEPNVSGLSSFSWLNNIPLYECSMISYPFFSWWLFGLFLTFGDCDNAAMIFVYRVLYECMFWILLVIHVGVELWSHW